MIPRYTLPEMGALWSEQNKFQKWLDVEIAVCEVHAEMGTIPHDALEQIKARARFAQWRVGTPAQVAEGHVAFRKPACQCRLDISMALLAFDERVPEESDAISVEQFKARGADIAVGVRRGRLGVGSNRVLAGPAASMTAHRLQNQDGRRSSRV